MTAIVDVKNRSFQAGHPWVGPACSPGTPLWKATGRPNNSAQSGWNRHSREHRSTGALAIPRTGQGNRSRSGCHQPRRTGSTRSAAQRWKPAVYPALRLAGEPSSGVSSSARRSVPAPAARRACTKPRSPRERKSVRKTTGPAVNWARSVERISHHGSPLR